MPTISDLSELAQYKGDIARLANSTPENAAAFVANPILFLKENGYDLTPSVKKRVRAQLGKRLVTASVYQRIKAGARLPWIKRVRLANE